MWLQAETGNCHMSVIAVMKDVLVVDFTVKRLGVGGREENQIRGSR